MGVVFSFFYLLRIDGTLIYHSKIPLQTQHKNGNLFAISMLEVSCNVIPPLSKVRQNTQIQSSGDKGCLLTALSPANVPRFEISNVSTTISGRNVDQCWSGQAVSQASSVNVFREKRMSQMNGWSLSRSNSIWVGAAVFVWPGDGLNGLDLRRLYDLLVSLSLSLLLDLFIEMGILTIETLICRILRLLPIRW